MNCTIRCSSPLLVDVDSEIVRLVFTVAKKIENPVCIRYRVFPCSVIGAQLAKCHSRNAVTLELFARVGGMDPSTRRILQSRGSLHSEEEENRYPKIQQNPTVNFAR